jgi:glycosyltransferase involved in cell wall biosynthesis
LQKAKMTRIGLDLSSLSGERARRGIGIYALNLTRALVKLVEAGRTPNLDFYFFSFNERSQLEALLEQQLPSTVKTITIPGGTTRLNTLLGHQFGLMWLAAQHRLHFLHALGYGIDPSHPGLVGLLPPTRLLVTMHDLIPLHYPNVFLTVRRKRLWYKLMLNRVAHAKFLLTNSDHTRQDVISSLHIDPAKILCIPFAADHLALPSTSSTSTPLPANLVAQSFILAVGGPQPHKNLPLLVRAFVKWQQDNQNLAESAQLVITGAGPSQAELTALVPTELQTQLCWLNNLTASEMTSLYQQARFLAFPSLYEGFGLPVLEALTLGCPVLCSRSAALPEIGGDAVAYINNPLDLHDLEQGLATMWGDAALRQRLQVAGLERTDHFSWQHTAEQTLQIYLRLAKNSN